MGKKDWVKTFCRTYNISEEIAHDSLKTLSSVLVYLDDKDYEVKLTKDIMVFCVFLSSYHSSSFSFCVECLCDAFLGDDYKLGNYYGIKYSNISGLKNKVAAAKLRMKYYLYSARECLPFYGLTRL